MSDDEETHETRLFYSALDHVDAACQQLLDLHTLRLDGMGGVDVEQGAAASTVIDVLHALSRCIGDDVPFEQIVLKAVALLAEEEKNVKETLDS